MRLLGIVLAVVLLFSGAIWLAHGIESGQFKRTPKPNEEQGLVVDLEPQERPDYVVYCNEKHFQEAFGRFRKHVHVDTDALAVPGGPIIIALGDVDLPPELQQPKRVAVEVLKRHAPNRVVLMAHEGCLIDDSIGAWLDDPNGVRQRQLKHLAQARLVLYDWFPGATVEVFYGEKLGDRQMRFFRVTDQQLQSAAASAVTDTGFIVNP